MRNSFFSSWALVLLTVVAASSLYAAEPATRPADKGYEEAVVALASAQAKAELALRNLRGATDDNRSGWNSVWQTLDATTNKILQTLERSREMEERKDEVERNQNLINQIREKSDEYRQGWEQFSAKTRTEAGASYRAAGETMERLNQTYEALASGQRGWKEADLDPAILQTAFEAIAKRAQIAREQAQAALGTLQQYQKTLEPKIEEADKFAVKVKKP